MKTLRDSLFKLCQALICCMAPGPALAEAVTEESPFLWFGKPYLASPPQVSIHVLERYGNAPKRFPTAASCGYAPTREGERLRPEVMATDEEFEVCLFRVIARLKTMPEIHAWMVRTGWRSRGSLMIPDEARFYGSDATLERWFYSWDIETNGVPFGHERLLDVRNSIEVSIVHSGNKGPLGVRSSAHSIWSK